MKKALAIAAILTLCTTAANADPNGVLTYNGPLGASGGTFTWTVTASADATVSGRLGETNTNYGSDNFLYVDKEWNGSAYDVPFRKFYMRFSMPSEYYFSGFRNVDGNNVSNIDQAILKLTYDASLDGNILLDPTQDGTYGKGYWKTESKNRLYGLVQDYDTWTEGGITWTNSRTNYGNIPTGNGKYFISSNAEANDANNAGYNNYYVGGAPVIPTIYLAEPAWHRIDPNAPHVDYFGLVKNTGKPVSDSNYWAPTMGPYDGNSNVQKGGGVGDANLPNFVDLIVNDTDHQVTIMVGINYLWPGIYSKEGAPDEASLPTMTITWVPEPATISLLMLGLGAVVMRRRRS